MQLYFLFISLIDPIFVLCFLGRGAGLSVTKTSNGVNISFSIGENLTLSVNSIDNIAERTSSIIWFLSKSGDVDLTSQQLIETAASNLMKSLSKEISQINLNFNQLSDEQTEQIKVDINGQTVSPPNSPPSAVFDIPVDDIAAVSNAFKAVSEARMQSSSSPSSSESSFESPASDSQKQRQPFRRDPKVVQRAREVGVKLESYENKGIEEQAQEELNRIIQNSKQQGFLSVLKKIQSESTSSSSPSSPSDSVSKEGPLKGMEVFSKGSELSQLSLQEIISRKKYQG